MIDQLPYLWLPVIVSAFWMGQSGLDGGARLGESNGKDRLMLRWATSALRGLFIDCVWFRDLKFRLKRSGFGSGSFRPMSQLLSMFFWVAMATSSSSALIMVYRGLSWCWLAFSSSLIFRGFCPVLFFLPFHFAILTCNWIHLVNPLCHFFPQMLCLCWNWSNYLSVSYLTGSWSECDPLNPPVSISHMPPTDIIHCLIVSSQTCSLNCLPLSFGCRFRSLCNLWLSLPSICPSVMMPAHVLWWFPVLTCFCSMLLPL